MAGQNGYFSGRGGDGGWATAISKNGGSGGDGGNVSWSSHPGVDDEPVPQAPNGNEGVERRRP